MSDAPSPIYPPRAGFGKRFRWRWTVVPAWRGRGFLAIAVPFGGRVLLSLAIPALGFALAGWRKGALFAAAAYLVSVLGVVVFLGLWPASLAGGALVGIHGAGTVYFLNRQPGLRIRAIKIIAAVMVSFMIALFYYIYIPATGLVEKVAFPFQTPGGPVMINTRTPLETIQRGDVVGFRMPRVSVPGYRVQEGAGVGRVLGVSGDVIRFAPGEVVINGIAQPALEGMPDEGELVVAEGHRFIWTPLRRSRYGNRPLSGITFALSKEVSMVPEANIMGKAFDRWFWRKQRYEPVQ